MECYRCRDWPCECKDEITILHGNCCELLHMFPENSVNMIFTDPPYGHKNNDDDLISRREMALGKDQEMAEKRPIENDSPEEADHCFKCLIDFSLKALEKGGTLCCCCGGGGGADIQYARWSLAIAEKMDFKQMVVWDKGPIGMGWHYRRSYECVLVANKKGANGNWFSDRRDIENVIRPSHKWAPKIIPKSHQHPTEKPAGLAEFFIGLHTKDQQLVIDPFMGSGSTLVAAKKLGRRAVGIDVSREYCDMAASRLEQNYLFKD